MLSSLLFSSFILLCNAAFDLPLCLGNDPITGQACGTYGYTETWTISNAVPNINAAANPSQAVQFITVNGKWPPPTVSVNKGERIRIKVINNSNEPVTLHFHGVLQENGYNVMDGPQGLVQSAILPSKSFIYDFPATKAGTYWIHSHVKGQYPKGLRSPLIVKDTTDPAALGYDTDAASDVLFTVSDFYPNFWKAEERYENGVYSGTTAKGTPNCIGPNGAKDSGLETPTNDVIVNDITPGRIYEGFFPNAPQTQQDGYYIRPGKKARIRFVNLSAFGEYFIFFGDHREFEVVELDSVLVQKKGGGKVRGFSLASGQRVSIVLDRSAEDPNVLDRAGSESLRIFFLSNSRISQGTSSSECKPATTLSGYVPQYAVGYIHNTLNQPTKKDRKELVTTQGRDMTDVNSAQATVVNRYLKTWGDSTDDIYASPFWTFRPKVPTEYEGGRKIDANTETIIPVSVFGGFTDTNFQSRGPNAEKPWMNPSEIRRIAILDHSNTGNANHGLLGAGQMGEAHDGVGAANWATPNNLFASPENQPGARPTSVRPTTLEYILNKFTSDTTVQQTAAYPDSPGDSPGTFKVSQSQTIVLNQPDAVVWIVIRSLRGDHPIHMHGHDFQILARTANTWDSSTNLPADYNKGWISNDEYKNRVRMTNQPNSYPVRRDTIMVEKGWDYIIAIKASNPGVWALHCHNDFHAASGMFMQIVETPLKLREKLGFYSWYNTDTCPSASTSTKLLLSTTGTISTAYNADPLRVRETKVMWPPLEQLFVKSWENYGWDTCSEYTANSMRRRGRG